MPYIIFGTSSWSLPEPRYSNTPSDFFSIFKFENEVNRVHQVVSCLPMDSAAVWKLTYSGIPESMLIFNLPKHFVAFPSPYMP